MDELDSRLLQAVQQGFPVCPAPYEQLADRCGTSPEEAERRIAAMRDDGIIRRLGAVLDSRALGMVTMLVSADIEPDAVDEVAACVDGSDLVTHSYLREGRPNLWFALVAPSREAIDAMVDEVGHLDGVLSVNSLAATKLFKLGVMVDTSPGRERP